MNESFKKELLDAVKKIEGFENVFDEENDIKELDALLGLSSQDLMDESSYSVNRGLGYQRISPLAIKPKYNYPTDSGFDLHSVIDITIPAFGRALIPTGLKFDIDDGYEIQIRTKSGLAINQGLIVLNSPGTVDNGYTGECKVPVFNTNPTPFNITCGMKVAQAVLCPVVNGRWVDLIEKDEILDKDRGDKGFGSTGIK
jgi:dUTP pyrophosphatase